MTDAVSIREVLDPHDPAIAGFGQLQTAAYFAPETLIPARYIPQLLGEPSPQPREAPRADSPVGSSPEGTPSGRGGAGPRRNFLVVAEANGRVVGGTLFHWLADAGSGFSSFLGVAREFRRQGIARRLHETRFALLDQAAGGQSPGVFIDVVSPTRLPPEELAREKKSGSDPWQRRQAFARLGFRQVDIRYEQPVGGPNGGPVTILDLLFCPHAPADSVPTALVVATMRAYWTPWLGAAASRHAAELESRANGKSELRLIPPDAG